MATTKGTLIIRDRDTRTYEIMAIVELANYEDIDKVIESIHEVRQKYEDWTMDDIYEEAFNGFDCEVTPIPWSDDDTYRELYI